MLPYHRIDMSCVICGNLKGMTQGGVNLLQHIGCPRCGNNVAVKYAALRKLDEKGRRLLSRECRKQSGTYADIGEITINALLASSLPTLSEQIDQVILYFGEKGRGNPEYHLPINEEATRYALAALLSLPFEHDLGRLGSQLSYVYGAGSTMLGGAGYFHDPTIGSGNVLSMTYKGWERYHNLTSEKFDEKKQAFFALQFPKNGSYEDLPSLNELYQKISTRSVVELGIQIWNPLLDEPVGGLIHSRMEVEIRKSLFVVADLSHGNQGAYWEAGFAHGIGLPVFYLCHEDKSKAVHFDTGPYYRIQWNDQTIDKTVADLFNTVRATLPNKVRMNE